MDNDQEKVCPADPAQSAPSAEQTIHKHRCMRCDEEFDCQTPGICQAKYDVMPMIFTKKDSIIYTGEHCPWSPNWDYIKAYAKRYAALRTAQLEREREKSAGEFIEQADLHRQTQEALWEMKTRAETAESALRDARELLRKINQYGCPVLGCSIKRGIVSATVAAQTPEEK